MTNYTRGRTKEYECMRMLEEQGYKTFRMAGSHSEVDVIALLSQGNYNEKPTTRLIQCKLGASSIKKAVVELQKLKEDYPFASVELWQFIPRVKEPKITIFKNKNI